MSARSAAVRRLADGRWRVTAVGGLAVLASALSMQPLLDRGWWLPTTALVVAVVVVTGALSRAGHLPAPLQPLAQAAALFMTITVVFAGDAARWGFLPGPDALARLRDLAAQGRAYAEQTAPPAGPDPGLLLLVVVGVGLVALAVDTLAAGLDLPGLTLVPLAAMFAVPWAINRGSSPGWAFVLVALAWLALLSSTQQERAAQWSPRARAGSPAAAAAIALAATAAALVSGGMTVPRGPVDALTTGVGSGGGTVELDALVSLRRSLVSNDDRVVLTYATTARSGDYLRLAVLDQFDGRQWRASPGAQVAESPPTGPDGGAAGAGSGDQAEYRLDVGPLGGETLPSPPGTVAVLNGDWPVQWDQRTSLPQRADGRSVEGSRISLIVAPPDLDPEGLRQASGEDPATGLGPSPEAAADPEPLTGPRLPQLAREITADAQSPYDAAVALQRWFTVEGDFTYSTQVEGGSDEAALDDFLDERVGYCEQFSATMALMARAVGIPARVVVGFTQGRRDGGQWVVRGIDAHAWPEIWMGAAGWVRFEPTPGNPTTRPPAYSQPSAADEPTDDATQDAAPADQPTDGPAPLPLDDSGLAGGGQGDVRGLPLRLILITLATAALLTPAALRVVRRRRRIAAAEPEAAYQEVVDTLVDLGLAGEGATPRATLATAAPAVASGPAAPEVVAALDRLRASVERTRYAGAPGPGDARAPASAVATLAPPRSGEDLAADLRVIRRALTRRTSWPRRLRAALWPQSVHIAAWRRLGLTPPNVED